MNINQGEDAMTITFSPSGQLNAREFLRELVNIAEINNAEMDGTMEPIKRIVADAEVVFAIWPDLEQREGIGLLIVKGEKLLEKVSVSGRAQTIKIEAINCVSVEQAVALKQMLGDRDLDS
jgi:hypothetical protein